MRGDRPGTKRAMIAGIFLTVIFFLVLPAYPSYAKTLYVSQTGADRDNTANTFSTIQAAVNAASDGDTVKAGPGTYRETINFADKALTLISEQGPAVTILAGSSADDVSLKRTVSFGKRESSEKAGDSVPVLSGFTISGSLGGAIYCDGSSPRLENLKIVGNRAEYSGAGLFCDRASAPIITDTEFSDNSAGSRGGAIYCRKNSSLILENVLITKNAAPSGSGIFCDQSSLSLIHVTLAGNSEDPESGISLNGNSSLTLKNSLIRNRIFFENTAIFSRISLTHSDISGGKNGISGAGIIDWLSGNIEADPLFADEQNGDFHLSLSSPCIGAGISDDDIPSADKDGNPRPSPAGSFPDMGAYEHRLGRPLTEPRNIYIDPAFTGNATGGPDAPYTSLSAAIAEATAGSSLYAAAGVFKENVKIINIKGLKIEGGWSNEGGVWTRSRPPDPNFSVIIAEGSPACHISRSPGTVIEGFTIAGEESGIKAEYSEDVKILSNIIRIAPSGKPGFSAVCGLCFEAGTGSVEKNRIHIVNIHAEVPVPGDAALLTSLSGTLRINNNIIALQGENLRGIREIGTAASPSSFLSNDFYAPENAVLYHDENGSGDIEDCGHLNDRTLSDIAERGGNFCNLLMLNPPCLPPCSDALALPTPEDTDNDGMPDNVEINYFGDMSQDGTRDTDGDGLTDAQEYIGRTDPTSADTDADRMPDRWEVEKGTDPLSDNSLLDSDTDGYDDLSEYKGGTDPLDAASYPFARDDIATADEGKSITVRVLNNDTETGIVLSDVTVPEHGTVTKSNTELRYSPNSGFSGKDSFEYTAVNSRGTSASALVTIYVRPLSTPENSLIFDGVNTYLIRKDMSDFPSESLTAEFWIKSSGITRYQTVISYTAKGSEKVFSLDMNENFNFNIHIAGEIKRIPDISVADGLWHHIALTWQSSDGKIEVFKDGFSGFSGNLSKGVSLASGGTLLVGIGQSCESGVCFPGTDAFAGALDHIRLWNTLRSEADIRSDMIGGGEVRGTGAEGLAAHWQFNEGTGQIVFDYSENANHAQSGAADSADISDPQFSADSPLAEHILYVDALFGNSKESGEALFPYKTPGAALENARPGTLIRVAAGLYPEPLDIANIVGLRLEGGWNNTAGNWTREDPPDPNATIIMGMNAAAGCRLNHAPCTVAEGFTIMSADRGAEIGDSQNVSFDNNIIHSSGKSAEGIFWSGSSGKITGNRLHISASEGIGSGIVLQSLSGNLRIENNIIYLQSREAEGIEEKGNGVSPGALINNEFYADETAVLYRLYQAEGITDCASLNASEAFTERGGNFCNLLPPSRDCSPPCSDAAAIPPPQDRDKDGMPDNWEIYYFGDLSREGAGDFDSDGKTDGAEYSAKSLPSNRLLKVLLYPQSAGGAWSADGGALWLESGEGLSDSGTYTLTFRETQGWQSPENRTLTVQEGEAKTLLAFYTQGNYLLEVSAQGCEGKVKIAEKPISLPWTGRFVSGDSVHIEAADSEECRFVRWTGSAESLFFSEDSMMDGDKSLIAVFAKRTLRFSRPDPNSRYMDIDGKIFDGSDQEIREGDEVAAFVKDENDRLIVAGHGFYDKAGYVVRLYGDDESTSKKDGAAQGDRIILKTYNEAEDKEHRVEELAAACLWEPGTRKQRDWKYLPIRRIPLHKGWNLIGFDTNIAYHTGTRPECDMIEGIEYEQVESIGDILHSIAGKYEDIRAFDCKGAVSYRPDADWSDMTYMAPGYGYEIKIRENSESDEKGLIYLETEGHVISGDIPIPLHPGWNLSAYLGDKVLYSGEVPSVSYPEGSRFCRISHIREAFCSIEGKYALIGGFDKSGAKSCVPGNWSDMTYTGPGYGYWIHISESGPAALVWDSSCLECGSESSFKRASPEHFTAVTLTRDSCRYIGKISISGQTAADHDDEIAVFARDESGKEFLAGAALVGETVPGYYSVRVYGDDPDTSEKDGAEKGEVLIFKVWDKSSNREHRVPPSSAYMSYEADEELLQPLMPPIWKESAAAFGLLNLNLPLIPGDTDGSGILDLRDAVLPLQAAADALESSVYPDAEINGDRRIGIAEALYVLRELAGL